ncbi:MAG: hypothetical protein ACKO5P_10835 [Nodosilinea sp.]
MAVLIVFNLILALTALWLARCLWQLGQTLALFNRQIDHWLPDGESDSGFLEVVTLIRQSQTQIAVLRRGYGQLQAGLNRGRQIVFLFTLMARILTLAPNLTSKPLKQKRRRPSTVP